MADYQENGATSMPMTSLSTSQEHLPPPRCVVDIAAYKEDSSLFETFLLIQGFGLGTLYVSLVIFVLFMLCKLWFTSKRRGPFIVVINILILCFAIFRVIFICTKGHILDTTAVGFFVQLIGDLSIPALTSAYAITVWVMFEIANVRMSRKLQNKAFLAIIIISHFIFVIIVDIVIGLNKGQCLLLLICQIFNVFWGLILTVLFIIATLKFYKIRRQHETIFRPVVHSTPKPKLGGRSTASISWSNSRFRTKKIISTRKADLQTRHSLPILPTFSGTKNGSASSVESGSESSTTSHVDDAIFNQLPTVDEVTHTVVHDSQMDQGKGGNDWVPGFQKREGIAEIEARSTSDFVTTVDIENYISNEVSAADETAIGATAPKVVDNESKVNKVQVNGNGLSQTKCNDVGKKCNFDDDGKQGTSLGNGDTVKNKNVPTGPFRTDNKMMTRGNSEEIVKIDNNFNSTTQHPDLADEIPRLASGSTHSQNGIRRTSVKPKFASTRKKNPTKKLETVGTLSAILGIAQVLLGSIGSGYIYNPWLIGTGVEPNPLVWLIFITILRILEFLFGLVLAFLAWQKRDPKMSRNA